MIAGIVCGGTIFLLVCISAICAGLVLFCLCCSRQRGCQKASVVKPDYCESLYSLSTDEYEEHKDMSAVRSADDDLTQADSGFQESNNSASGHSRTYSFFLYTGTS